MSDKKHMGSKLAQGVRQVQSERDEQRGQVKVTAAPDPAPEQNSPPPPVTGAPVTGGQTKKQALHPKRVWPD